MTNKHLILTIIAFFTQSFVIGKNITGIIIQKLKFERNSKLRFPKFRDPQFRIQLNNLIEISMIFSYSASYINVTLDAKIVTLRQNCELSVAVNFRKFLKNRNVKALYLNFLLFLRV